MVIDERTRHQLYLRLEEVLGRKEAETLMGHLPPLGWGDVATKKDLELLRSQLEERMAKTESRTLRTIIFANASLALTVGALAFGAAKLV